jgi:transcription initiation factor TFIIB
MRQTASFHEKGSKAEARAELRAAHHEVYQVGAKLSLSVNVTERAAELIVVARGAPFSHGIPQPVMVAATLYVACRENKTPVTLRDLAYASGSDSREVGRCYLQLLDNLHITRPGLNGKGYVHHLALKRPVSEQAQKLSQEIINKMSAQGFGGRNPMTMAAAALYLACCSIGENITQSEVAEAAGVGEESVRECCKAIRTFARQSAV